MHYKTQSILTISIVVVFMIVISLSMGGIDEKITGAAIKSCECYENSDCNDDNPNTTDICIDKESCEKSYCVNE